MKIASEKTMTLSQAVARFVGDGDHLSLGGFTINRNPMAAVYEIIRQGKKNLHLYAHSNGQAIDELIGAGCVSRIEIAYGGSGRFAPTCIRFKRAVQDGRIAVEDYSNYQMTLRFLAGAMGVPFLPTRSSLGTSIIDKWGFPEAMRQSEAKLPDKKLCVVDNPFDNWGDVSKLVLVPAINPDVTIIHVQKAGPRGTVQIEGLTFADVEQVKAARHVIVTCESVVESDELREQSDQNQIPFFCVDAVVPVPMGAYPTACYGHYDYDPVFLNKYRDFAMDDEAHGTYLKSYIHGVKDHEAFVALAGREQIQAIKADPRTGYAVGLDRL
jgi:glutaconate CoA-transferase subunit A